MMGSELDKDHAI